MEKKIIHKGYKFRLYPNKEQKTFINKSIGSCRFVYNYFLDTKTKYYTEHKYELPDPTTNWGYQLQNGQSKPFFQAIRLYSLHKRSFTEYILVRPNIKSFKFGEHNNSESTSIMQIDMTIEYETVVYNTGSFSKKKPDGWADMYYDKGPSPMAPAGGGGTSILGAGGLLDTSNSILNDISTGNIGNALWTGARGAQKFGSVDLGKMALGEAISVGRGTLSGNNPLSGVSFPNASSVLNSPITTASPAVDYSTIYYE